MDGSVATLIEYLDDAQKLLEHADNPELFDASAAEETLGAVSSSLAAVPEARDWLRDQTTEISGLTQPDSAFAVALQEFQQWLPKTFAEIGWKQGVGFDPKQMEEMYKHERIIVAAAGIEARPGGSYAGLTSIRQAKGLRDVLDNWKTMPWPDVAPRAMELHAKLQEILSQPEMELPYRDGGEAILDWSSSKNPGRRMLYSPHDAPVVRKTLLPTLKRLANWLRTGEVNATNVPEPSQAFWDLASKEARALMRFLLANGPRVRCKEFANVEGGFRKYPPERDAIRKAIDRLETLLADTVNGWHVERSQQLDRADAEVWLIRPGQN